MSSECSCHDYCKLDSCWIHQEGPEITRILSENFCWICKSIYPETFDHRKTNKPKIRSKKYGLTCLVCTLLFDLYLSEDSNTLTCSLKNEKIGEYIGVADRSKIHEFVNCFGVDIPLEEVNETIVQVFNSTK